MRCDVYCAWILGAQTQLEGKCSADDLSVSLFYVEHLCVRLYPDTVRGLCTMRMWYSYCCPVLDLPLPHNGP